MAVNRMNYYFLSPFSRFAGILTPKLQRLIVDRPSPKPFIPIQSKSVLNIWHISTQGWQSEQLNISLPRMMRSGVTEVTERYVGRLIQLHATEY